jgi:predicted homoserine dehydrogenase-like protein
MVIADKLLAEREAARKPIRVAMVGAGVTGRMIALQLLTPVLGIRLVAITNRTLEKGERAFRDAGVEEFKYVSALKTLEDRVADLRPSLVEDAGLVTQAGNIDLIVDVTGTVEFGANLAQTAIRFGKHLVLVNAELDSTLGPILKFKADRRGTVITNTDGDEPGVAMTLLRYVKSLGLRPVAAGNLKGLIDRYRTPETQAAFAAKYDQDPVKVTSFADGTKLSMEATILANASGFRVGTPGMYGPKCAHVREVANLLPKEELLSYGLVDYALGAEPGTGAFVVVYEEHPKKRRELAYYKMGEGPFYVFYTPYHLPHLQIASTIARAALFKDATVAPAGPPVTEVAAYAKRDLKAGEILDGVGGFMSYGVIENASFFAEKNRLPMGIAGDCRLLRAVAKDEPLSYDDVGVPSGRTCDSLRKEQSDRFNL